MKNSLRISAILFAACILSSTGTIAAAETGMAKINGIGDNSAISGEVKLLEVDNGLEISIEVMNAPAGNHGIHIHQYGSCEENGMGAGGHFNPDQSNHGEVENRSVYEVHPGDLGNIKVDADGNGSKTLFVESLGLTENIFNVAGRAVILHEKEDDFGQPTGNAGGRIGCGTIAIVKDA